MLHLNLFCPQTLWETQSGSHGAGSRKSISQSALALPPTVLHSRYWLEELSTHQTQRQIHEHDMRVFRETNLKETQRKTNRNLVSTQTQFRREGHLTDTQPTLYLHVYVSQSIVGKSKNSNKIFHLKVKQVSGLFQDGSCLSLCVNLITAHHDVFDLN